MSLLNFVISYDCAGYVSLIIFFYLLDHIRAKKLVSLLSLGN